VECQKKRNIGIVDHVDRIITLTNLANCLEGTAPNLTDDQITLMIYNTFPEKWRDEFMLNRG
jgi:hypothetical protein